MYKFTNGKTIKTLLFIALVCVFQVNANDWENLSQTQYVNKLIKCNTKINELKWQNNLWPKENKKIKPVFAEILNQDEIHESVENILKQQYLLKKQFDFNLSQESLQNDLNRMAYNTKKPHQLKQLFDILDNNAQTIAECISRPFLVKKQLEENYYWDKEIHSELYLLAQTNFNEYIKSNNTEELKAEKSRVIYRIKQDKKSTLNTHQNKLIIEVNSEEFSLILNRLKNKNIKEEKYSFKYVEVIKQTKSTIEINIFQWRKMYLNDWFKNQPNVKALQLKNINNLSMPLVSKNTPFDIKSVIIDKWKKQSFPTGRRDHTAVWTGNDMIIWGGRSAGTSQTNTGFKYNPTTDSWLAINSISAPQARTEHSAIWTGSEMIIWGGFVGFSRSNTGARYNSVNDTWTTVSASLTPSARYNHTTIWTGDKMIVWGGDDGSKTNTGGLYDPITDIWTETNMNSVPSARILHTAVWANNEMIIWGGQKDGATSINTGGKYNPITDSWTATNTILAPGTRKLHSAVWTDNEMIVWGGIGFQGNVRLVSGGKYNPITDSWTSTDTNLGFPATSGHTAIWTGQEMIVWGSNDTNNSITNTGGSYNPVLDLWTPTSTTQAPEERHYHTAVWTESEMIVWGGLNDSFLDSGSRYDPLLDAWNSTSTSGSPSVRYHHTAIWTGNNMIVWGGLNSSELELKSGGLYNPTTDNWLATNIAQAPSQRRNHTAVWSGSEMIIWGGNEFIVGTGVSYLNTGGRYNPMTDSWTITETNLAPSNRGEHTAVWADNEMIIWGGKEYINGVGFSNLNTGGIYNLSTNSWSATTSNSAPVARTLHTAIWTGDEMIIWGGKNTNNLNSGSRYDPLNDSWTQVTLSAAPTNRKNHTAIWTGSEMIIWGGRSIFYEESGARYNPLLNSWTPTNLNQAPSGRELHSAIWTGDEMIAWGGDGAGPNKNTGGRYNPVSDSWLPTTTILAPSKIKSHTSVWTNNEMIIWGGEGSGQSNEMGIYSLISAYFIGGNLSGMHTGNPNTLTVQNNNTDDLILFGDGAFVFNTPILDLQSYNVTIHSHPESPIQPCSVSLASGNIAGNDVTDIQIDCAFGDDLIFKHGFELP